MMEACLQHAMQGMDADHDGSHASRRMGGMDADMMSAMPATLWAAWTLT